MNENNIVIGDNIEPDESRTPTEFAEEEMWTQEQVAKHFGCSATRVREWIASGQLTPVIEGSVERVRRSEVERLGNPDEVAAHEFESEHTSER